MLELARSVVSSTNRLERDREKLNFVCLMQLDSDIFKNNVNILGIPTLYDKIFLFINYFH